MLTVLMECHNQEPELAHTLSVLVTGAVEGLVSDVVVLDHGSADGTERVAEAAGCRFHRDWDLAGLIATVRGDWLLLIEPGARPQYGWVDELAEYITLNAGPARFSPSRTFRRPFLKRLFQPAAPLESGFVLSKREAQSAARAGMSLAELTQGIKTRRLTCEMIPAWAMRGR
ncbi:MAG: glycosyl transferase [Proteobacteria bacterium]|nr:glycosyl transferase [Pseudomonadota bacterium]